MRYPAKRVKNLALAFKEIEQHVRQGKPLQTGKPFSNFAKMRPREFLANALICAAANCATEPERFTFAAVDDPDGGDGVIEDTQTTDTQSMFLCQTRKAARPRIFRR